MRDLMPEMTEQRAIGLAHRATLPLAFGIVGFGEIDRDCAVQMPGHDRLMGRREKVECQSRRILDPRHQRQLQPQQAVEQPALRHLEPAPQDQIVAAREVGNDPVVPAGDAEVLRALLRDQPVAALEFRIGAEPVGACRNRPARETRHRPARARSSASAAADIQRAGRSFRRSYSRNGAADRIPGKQTAASRLSLAREGTRTNAAARRFPVTSRRPG